MTEILVPYARFVEGQTRRARIDAELTRNVPTPVVDVTDLPEAVKVTVQLPTVVPHD